MWFALISLAVIVFIYFKRDVSTLKQEMVATGGMKKKYSLLINSLLEGDSRSKIYKETPTILILGVEGYGAYTKFELEQAFDTLFVFMTVDTKAFGKHQLKWEFNDKLSQEKMVEIIGRDINEKLNSKLP